MGSNISVPENIEYDLGGVPAVREIKKRNGHKPVYPVKETEEHRKMRAAYLAMGRDRSLTAVAAQFGYNYITVQRVAKAFKWSEDAKDRDSAINDAFVEEHRQQINRARNLIFQSILKDVEAEALKRGIKVMPEDKRLKYLSEKEMEDLFIKTEKRVKMKFKPTQYRKVLSVDNYKEMNDLLNALRKVVYEWQPGEAVPAARGVGGFSPTVKGNLNVQLIIEK